jgi:hypothetical protein
VVLGLPPDLDPAAARATAAEVGGRLREAATVTERVTGVELSLRPV